MFRWIRSYIYEISLSDQLRTEIRMLCNCDLKELKGFDIDKLSAIKNLLLMGHKFESLKELSYENLWVLEKLRLMGMGIHND
jgi:hypothetical protein